jgi:hypothetical protein
MVIMMAAVTTVVVAVMEEVTDMRSLSNQTMKPTAPWRNKFSVFATTPCRGLSLSR